ncbi:MAG TPA: hypothetical protein VFX16_26795 [Pseudonocardiaceae bacterium]|nr:hypothetical protein [Pseudonocardiaceae bacterium]
MRTLLVDNHDSYTFNLFQLIAEVSGTEPVVVVSDDPALATMPLLCVAGPLPGELVGTAWAEDGVLMALRRRELPRWGVHSAVDTETVFTELFAHEPDCRLGSGMTEPGMARFSFLGARLDLRRVGAARRTTPSI